MKTLKRTLAFILTASLLLCILPASVSGLDDAEPLALSIVSDKTEYGAAGLAKVVVTAENTGGETLNDVRVDFLPDETVRVYSQGSASLAGISLEPGETIELPFFVCLNRDKVRMNLFDRLFLAIRISFKRLQGFKELQIQPDEESGNVNAAQNLSFGQTVVALRARADYTTGQLPMTKAEIIAFYNQYANAMKAYKGSVTVTKKSGTTTTIHEISPDFISNIAEDMLPNDYEQKPTYTFVNGKSTSGNVTLSAWLPRSDSPLMSELSPAEPNGVKSATCVTSGSGRKITIVMNDDKTSGTTALSDKPKYVSKCMDTLKLTAEDLQPFTVENANINYTGCKIEAAFDAQGRMTKLDITTPVNIVCTLRYSVTRINADITGTYKGNYTFTY